MTHDGVTQEQEGKGIKITNVGSGEIPELEADESRKAINEMKIYIARREDQIVSEPLKKGEEELLKSSKILFNKCQEEMRILDDSNNVISL